MKSRRNVSCCSWIALVFREIWRKTLGRYGGCGWHRAKLKWKRIFFLRCPKVREEHWHFGKNKVSLMGAVETYRSGHNGADSKSVCRQLHVGSNPTVSAKSDTAVDTIVSTAVSLFYSPEHSECCRRKNQYLFLKNRPRINATAIAMKKYMLTHLHNTPCLWIFYIVCCPIILSISCVANESVLLFLIRSIFRQSTFIISFHFIYILMIIP